MTGMPPPSASLVIVRLAIETHLDMIGPKKGNLFIRSMAERIANEERVAGMLHVRPPEDMDALRAARLEAMAWLRQMLPVFLARLQ